MGVNDVFFLESLLKQKKEELAPLLKEDDFFEIFAFDQILKKYYLSLEELSQGNVDNGDDGGFDGFFIFVDKNFIYNYLIETEGGSNLRIPRKRNIELELYLIQSKNQKAFKETVGEKMLPTIMDLFDLRKEINKFQKNYNEKFIQNVFLFRECITQLLTCHPKISIHFVYVTKGNKDEINSKVKDRFQKLEKATREYLSDANVSTLFWGASDLLEASRQEPTYTLSLNFIKTISKGQNYIFLSALEDYYKFISDENGNLRRYIFESNIRDYQGDVGVNRNIRETLSDDADQADFWWLNNGVTILASNSTIAGETITLDDVQIVNGLQTTTEIYNYFANLPATAEYLSSENASSNSQGRAVLVKVIVTGDNKTRERIIKATNYQTPIPTTQISIVTEPIQRDVEQYLLSHDWYYDRRKNYYKNIGKPIDRIISITYLGQAVMAVALQNPHTSIAKGSSSLIISKYYKQVFDPKFKPSTYLFCILLLKEVEKYINCGAFESFNPYPSTKREFYAVKSLKNLSALRFHIAMFISCNLMRKKEYNHKDIENLNDPNISSDLINTSVDGVIKAIISYVKTTKGSSLNDIKSIASSEAFTSHVLSSANL